MVALVILNSFNFYTRVKSDLPTTTTVRVFWIWPYTYLYQWALFFHMFSYWYLIGFCFNLKNSFNISYEAWLVVMNFLSFYLWRKVFIFPFLKDNFGGYSTLGWSLYFSFPCFECIILLSHGRQGFCWEMYW